MSITVDQISYESYYDEVYAGNHGQLVSLGWCADYPDPENFADILFHSGSEQNLSGYSSPELDAMLESARSMADTGKRLALYQEIEQAIVNDMPVLFLTHTPAGTLQSETLRAERGEASGYQLGRNARTAETG